MGTVKRYRKLVAAGLVLAWAGSAGAVDLELSGFGTLGVAVSDSAITYQRYIDDDGTLLRDSLLAVQANLKINDQWSATSQVLLAPASDADDELAVQLKWTMLSYRPANDWLIRVGRLSLGGLLNQQNMDVGVSYDMARLPNEVYLLSDSYDFDGISIAKTWSTDEYEITVDGSLGMQNREYRMYYNGSKQSVYYFGDVVGGGVVVTVNDYGQRVLRLGWNLNQVDSDHQNGVVTQFTYIPLGGGRYTLGPPVYSDDVTFNTLFFGVKFPVQGFMVAAEMTAVLSDDVEPTPNSYGGYVNISRKIEKWTPYLTYARLWSEEMDHWRKVRAATPVPQMGITPQDISNGASVMAVFDQYSLMAGVSYAFTPQHKLKAEAMLTHIGERSQMFDGDIADENVMVYSLSYSFSF